MRASQDAAPRTGALSTPTNRGGSPPPKSRVFEPKVRSQDVQSRLAQSRGPIHFKAAQSHVGRRAYVQAPAQSPLRVVGHEDLHPAFRPFRQILNPLVLSARYSRSEPCPHRDLRVGRAASLDELAPFGYPNFAQILQTASGTNTAFLFSMQSLPQILQDGKGFKDDVTTAR
jgi:hypothetical protein